MNTGGDLLNNDQPAYVLGATSLSSEAAREILAVFSLPQGQEVHFRRLRRSRRGRAQILEALQSLDSGKAFVGAVHKRFMVYAKLVDDFLDFAYHRDTGKTLVEGGAHRATANLLFYTAPVLLGGVEHDLETRFVEMYRERSHASIERFYSLVRRLHRHGPEDLRGWMSAILSTRENVHTIINSEFPLDPSLTTFVALVGAFRASAGVERPFRVLYDRSNVMEAQMDMLARLCDQSRPPTMIGGGQGIRLPLPVSPLDFVASHESAAVQVADLVAGATGLVARSLATGRTDDFVEELAPVVDQFLVHMVWPSTENIARDDEAFPPGVDPAAQTAHWLFREA